MASDFPVEWRISDGFTDYEPATAFMERRAAEIAAGEAREMVWLVQHPPLYTAGTSARDEAARTVGVDGRTGCRRR